MPQIGPLEIAVVALFALLIFGPEKLPEMARSMGKGLNQLRKMGADVKSEFNSSLASTDAPDASGRATETKVGAAASATAVTVAPADDKKKASPKRAASNKKTASAKSASSKRGPDKTNVAKKSVPVKKTSRAGRTSATRKSSAVTVTPPDKSPTASRRTTTSGRKGTTPARSKSEAATSR